MNEITLLQKYEPKSLDTIVGQTNIVKILRGYVHNNNIPHLLFTGAPGIGKTTVANCIARDLFGEHWKKNIVMMNASDERGIDIVRGKIKEATRYAPIGGYPFKIIFLDEMEEMCIVKGTKIVVGFNTGSRLCNIENVPTDRYTSICSLNTKTKEIEEDKGICIDTGISEVYQVTLEDGRTIECTSKHPFFVIKDDNIVEKRLCDLGEDDEIIDFSEEVVNSCKVCGEYTMNDRFCSVKCKDIGHSKDMSGEGNSMYGKNGWNKGLKEKDDPRINTLPGRKAALSTESRKKAVSSLHQFHKTEEGQRILKKTAKKIGDANSGKKNGRYIDGRYTNLINWQEEVLYRGGYKCTFCRSIKNLVCHHIMNVRDYPDEIYNIYNGQVLCNSCHTTLHNTYRRWVKRINDNFTGASL